jgi:hypothetical protein
VGVNQKLYSHQQYCVNVIGCSQAKGVKPKERERKSSGVNWQGVLKKTNGRKTSTPVIEYKQ